jgi:hypothetical protein
MYIITRQSTDMLNCAVNRNNCVIIANVHHLMRLNHYHDTLGTTVQYNDVCQLFNSSSVGKGTFNCVRLRCKIQRE